MKKLLNKPLSERSRDRLVIVFLSMSVALWTHAVYSCLFWVGR